jgi:Putative adhesin
MPTFDTPEPIVATVDIAAGRVMLRASDRHDTVVEVTPTDPSDDADVRAARQTIVECSRGKLVVKGPKKRKLTLFGRGPAIDVRVDLPGGSTVNVDAWAEVSAEGRLGDTRLTTAIGPLRLDVTGPAQLRTAAGEISVTRIDGNADVGTSAGDIRIGAVHGDASVKTSSGNLTLGDVSGDLRLRSSNGNIAVDRAGAEVRAKTARGSVRIGEVVRGPVDMHTAFGDLELGVREGPAVWLDVSANAGSVRSELETTDRPGPSEETLEIRGRTGFGNIVIRRAVART